MRRPIYEPRTRLTRADFAELEARVLAAEKARSTLKAQGGSLYAICPPAIRYGQDEYRCQKCGVVWGVDEPRPPCQGTNLTRGNT